MLEHTYGTALVDRPDALVEEAPSLAEGAVLLAAHRDAVARLHAAQVEVVELTDQLRRAGVVEPLEGLPLDLWLAVEHRMTGGERWMLLTAGEVLAAMPVTATLFREGKLSWSQVRDVVGRARRLPVAARGELDRAVAASLDLLDRLDPDGLRWAVEQACDELEGVRAKERGEERDAAEDFVAVQLGLDGGSRWFTRMGPVGTAVALAAMDRRAAADHRDAATRAQGRARALQDLCAEDLSGDSCCDDGEVTGTGAKANPVDGVADDVAGEPGVGAQDPDGGDRQTNPGGGGDDADTTAAPRWRCRRRKAHPLITVHVPLDRATPTAAGLVEVDVPGWLPTLSARLVELLARDADVQAVVFDGRRPLATTRVLRAAEVTDKTRVAVRARDLGDRTPGSNLPITATELHHLDRIGEGHHPEHLVSLSKRGHLRVVHRHGWSIQVDGDTGDTVWTRGQRSIRTAPAGTPLRRPPPIDPLQN